MYAIIETGSKQYRVSPGDTLTIERTAYEDDTIAFDRVLAIRGEEAFRIGSPVVEGARVTARVLGEEKGDKIIVFKKKRRKQYKKTMGHRQKLLRIRIEAIEGA